MIKNDLEHYDFRVAWLSGGPAATEIIKNTFSGFKTSYFNLKNKITKDDVEKIAETNCNFLIFPFFLGNPAGQSLIQQETFAQVAEIAGDCGIETIALITPSSYCNNNEYSNVDWAAVLPDGKPSKYSITADRNMACWNNDDWTDLIRETIVTAAKSSCSGILLDFVCFGSAPFFTGRDLIGNAGCHCVKCNNSFKNYLLSKDIKPFRIPPKPSISNNKFLWYSSWRTEIVSNKLELYHKALKENDQFALFGLCVPGMPYMPVKHIFGIDTEWVLEKPDYLVLEHHRTAVLTQNGLIYESPGIKTVISGSKFPIVTSISYNDDGLTDKCPSATEIIASLSASFSCGSSPVTRLGPYRNGKDNFGDFLTEENYSDNRINIATFMNWLEKNRDIYDESKPSSRKGILFSWKELDNRPYPFIKYFYTILNTLTEIQLPLRVICEENILAAKDIGLDLLIIPYQIDNDTHSVLESIFSDCKFLYIDDQSVHPLNNNSGTLSIDIFETKKSLKKKIIPDSIANFIEKKLFLNSADIYGGFPVSRRAGYPSTYLSNFEGMNYAYFPTRHWKTLRDKVVSYSVEDFNIEGPPYIQIQQFRKGSNEFFHFYNLLPDFPAGKHVAIHFKEPVKAKVIHTTHNRIVYIENEKTIVINPEPYTILEVKNRF